MIIPPDARRWLVAVVGLIATLALPALMLVGPLVLMTPPAEADARSEYLIRLLQGSTQFRVRAQAAISLGGVEGAPEVVDALSKALSDEHPAVRAAAANSLGHLADPRALRPLRAVTEDPEPPVRLAVKAAIAKLEAEGRKPNRATEEVKVGGGPPRYYVALGKPASRASGITPQDLERARQILRDRLGEIDGVVLAPPEESPAAVRSVLRSRKLKGFYIESSVTSLEQKPGGGVRAAVSLIVATYPDRAMRAIMQGAATAMGGGDIREQAVAGALKSALSQLPQAMIRE